MKIDRTLNLLELLSKKSHFLFGPRGTGKTQLIGEQLASSCTVIDLLLDDVYSRLLRRPSLLEEFIPETSNLVAIDEIQKIPALLDEVHRIIEARGTRFLLTGSSARKLRRGGANLLGGRAWESRLFPLTSAELGSEFDLERYLNRGGLPAIYFSDYPEDELKNYLKLYLREEIQAEMLVRRLDHFSRFLDTMGLVNAQELNFEGISNECGVPARTVASYLEVLEDTLVGFQVEPFTRTKTRKAIKRAKFYFFDVGVAGAIAKRGQVRKGSELFGIALEQFVAQELRAYLSYKNSDQKLCYWRSTSQKEVDFIVGAALALEVKSTHNVGQRDLSGLKALREEKLIKRFMVVCDEPIERTSDGIQILPWRSFLTKLWSDELLR